MRMPFLSKTSNSLRCFGTREVVESIILLKTQGYRTRSLAAWCHIFLVCGSQKYYPAIEATGEDNLEMCFMSNFGKGIMAVHTKIKIVVSYQKE